MATQIDTSTNADATSTPSGAQVVLAPSDATANVIYFGNSGPELATAASPYTTWAKQAIGAATTHNSQSMAGHVADDNLDLIVTSPSNGPFWFTGTRSGGSWTLAAQAATGDANNAGITANGVAMFAAIDAHGRFWYIGLDDIGGTYLVAAAHNAGGAFTIDTTLEALVIGETNRRGIAAAQIGNYLVVVYDSGSGALKYTRLDTSVVSLGAWSTPVTFGSISDVTAASVLTLRAIPGGSTGMLAYSGGNGISALAYDASGNTWAAATVLSASTSDRHPCLISGASGTVYAVWCEFAAANSYALVGKAYTSGAWASKATLEASGSNIAWPNGAYLSSGTKLALTWTQGTGSPWAVQFDAVSAPAGGASANLTVALGGSGGVGVSGFTVGISGALGGSGGLSIGFAPTIQLTVSLGGSGGLGVTLPVFSSGSPSMPSAAELASAAADMVAALCDKQCTISRNQGTVSRGHKLAAFAIIASGTPCNLTRPSSGLFREIAARLATVNVWDVSLPPGTDVREGDHLTVGTDVLTVHSVATPESLPLLLHVLAAEVV